MQGVPVLRVAAIHDLSGFGRASLTVAVPILATMGIQVCPLPTAVLSSQTSGVDDFTFHDLTPQMGPALDHWQRLGLRFDAVYSGFLGNPVRWNWWSAAFGTSGGRAASPWWTRSWATTAASTLLKLRIWWTPCAAWRAKPISSPPISRNPPFC